MNDNKKRNLIIIISIIVIAIAIAILFMLKNNNKDIKISLVQNGEIIEKEFADEPVIVHLEVPNNINKVVVINKKTNKTTEYSPELKNKKNIVEFKVEKSSEFEYYTMDKNGNKSEIKTFSVKIDKESPNFILDESKQVIGVANYDDSKEINIDIKEIRDDSNFTISYNIDNGSYKNIQVNDEKSTLKLQLKPGTHNITIKAIDESGKETIKEKEIEIYYNLKIVDETYKTTKDFKVLNGKEISYYQDLPLNTNNLFKGYSIDKKDTINDNYIINNIDKIYVLYNENNNKNNNDKKEEIKYNEIAPTFYYLNGSKTLDKVKVEIGKTSEFKTLKDVKTPDGYILIGWSKSKTISTENLVNTDTNITISSNTNYYAIYEKEVTLSFNTNGGSNINDIKEKVYQDYQGNKKLPKIIINQTTTKANNVFKGFYLENTFVNKVDTSIEIDKDTTIYTKWNNKSTITLNYDGYTYIDLTMGVSYSNLPFITTEDNSFNGWYNNDSVITIESIVPTNDLVLTAKFNDSNKGQIIYSDNYKNMTLITSDLDINKNLYLLDNKNIDNVYVINNYTNNPSWVSNNNNLENITINKSFNEYKPTNMEGWFYSETSSVTTINGIDNIDTSNTTNMKNLFNGLSKLNNLDLSTFNTSKVTNMEGMFNNLSNITELDVKDLDTSKVTNMKNMFSNMTKLKELDLYTFDTSKVTNFTEIFINDTSLERIYSDKDWNSTGIVTDHNNMFLNCESLVGRLYYEGEADYYVNIYRANPKYYFTKNDEVVRMKKITSNSSGEINLNGTVHAGIKEVIIELNTNHDEQYYIGDLSYYNNDLVKAYLENNILYVVANEKISLAEQDIFEYLIDAEKISGLENTSIEELTVLSMFAWCQKLKTIEGMQTWDTSNIISMNCMFLQCNSITTIDLSSFDISNVRDVGFMFYEDGNLTTIYVDESWNMDKVANYVETTNVYAGEEVFTNCTKLVGQISYNSSKKNYTYANYTNGYLKIKEVYLRKLRDTNISGLSEVTKLHFEIDKTYDDQYFIKDVSQTGYDNIKLYIIDNEAYITSPKKIYFPEDSSWMFFDLGKINEITGIENTDTKYVTTMYGMFTNHGYLTSLDLTSWNTSKVTSMDSMFLGCIGLTELKINTWDTSRVNNFQGMFRRTTSLKSLDVSNFSMNAANTFADMFNESAIESFTGEDWVIDHASNFYEMFMNSKVKTLDLSKWNMTYATDLRSMFYQCKDLTSINIVGWNTSSVKYSGNMFYYCSSLTELDLSGLNFDNSEVKTGMFAYCLNLEKIYITREWNNDKAISQYANMFNGDTKLVGKISYDGSKISGEYANSEGYFTRKHSEMINLSTVKDNLSTTKYLVFENSWGKTGTTPIDISQDQNDSINLYVLGDYSYICSEYLIEFPSNGKDMFSNLTNIISITFDNIDTTNLTTMEKMFYKNTNLTSIDLTKFNTSNVTNMMNVFEKCSSLTSANVEGLDVSKVTNMNAMFLECENLNTLDLSTWETTRLQETERMFKEAKLTSITFGNFYFNNITDATSMFEEIEATTLDLSVWNTEKLEIAGKMFEDCSYLKTIYIGSNWDLLECYDTSLMFAGCVSIVGQNGKTYDPSHDDKTFANANDGYFTRVTHLMNNLSTLDSSIFDGVKTIDFEYGYNYVDQEYYDVSQNQDRSVKLYIFNDEAHIVSTKYIEFPEDCTKMFDSFMTVEYIRFNNFVITSNTTIMSQMFNKLYSLKTLDLSSFDTSNVTAMNSLVFGSHALTSINLNGFDTSKVTTMRNMFGECYKLETLDLSMFNTSNVENMSQMFVTAQALVTIYVDNDLWDMTKVSDSTYMFKGCYALVGAVSYFVDNNSGEWANTQTGYLTQIPD